MLKLGYPADKRVPYIVILSTYALYVVIFAIFHHNVGSGIAALATVPVIGASWYFGIRGGVLTAVLSILANIILLGTESPSHIPLINTPGHWIGGASLILTGLVVGSLGTVARERREAIFRLEQYEQDHKAHTRFLELLNEITVMALESDSLDTTFKILGERIGSLFKADDCFFALWDEKKTSAHSHGCVWLPWRYLSLCTV